MAEPVLPTGLWLTTSGTIAAVFGFVFDVPASTVFAAAAGAFFAVRLSDTVGFFQSLRMISAGTFAGALLTALFIAWAGPYPQRGVAMTLAFVLIYYRVELLASVRTLLKGEGLDRLRAILEGFKK